ncbi:unnamed protein product [Mycena citricolor]|uniref:Elongator complex protein 1 n=1 Tax=Mycena citricolor TaxID=2018698 RepID=A0AAD2HTK7_9AGAR|nr:unnamed protein product [Mycena citricolor]
MRNLSLAFHLDTVIAEKNVTQTTFDLDEDILYAATERINADADVDVKVWKFYQKDRCADPEAILVTMFTAGASSSSTAGSQIVAFHFLPDTRSISVLMRAGDITTVSVDEDTLPEVEGTIESGIMAAAWSPDDSLLAIVTGESKLTLMSPAYDMISDGPLYPTEFGEDAPINVGWGSKQTQFHGSLGKAAAAAPSATIVGASPDDDHVPRVSWRGDGAFFVVSSLAAPTPDGRACRALRVYDRQAVLQSTSEPVPGLEHPVSWRPSGNLIASTQRFGFEGGGAGKEGRHDVVFFERNGLRHGEFGIRVADLSLSAAASNAKKWGYKVKELSWGADSNVLGVWIQKDAGDVFQLWTTGNYHWYLKHEFASSERFTSIRWHPEQALHVVLTTSSSIIQRIYGWETWSSPSSPPNDSGTVAVLDGSKVLLTPFRSQNVPPPMSSYQQMLSINPEQPTRIPVHLSLSPENETLAVLWESGYLELWDLNTRIAPGPSKIMDPAQIFAESVGRADIPSRQVIVSSDRVFILGSRAGCDVVTSLVIGKSDVTTSDMQSANGRLVPCASSAPVWQSSTGQLFEISASPVEIGTFDEFCFSAQGIPSKTPMFLGLSTSGKLHLSSTSSRTLASNVTSFTVTSGFVVFTSAAHEATFLPVPSLQNLLALDEETGEFQPLPSDWEKRRVERGSRIVVAVPSAMTLVLQMPRGNLETINPRPLVIQVVHQDLAAHQYRKAFLSCRKHRIDLNVLVEHDRAAFIENIPTFLDQVHEVDYINLFLTNIGRGTQSPEHKAEVCDAVRVCLAQKDLTKYVNSILTAYVVKSPPEAEAGLGLLLQLKDSDPEIVEDAVKYIIFLVDADTLFNTALGMYDFALVLMIAQHAQKDPREYLPFLRELRSLEQFYQRYRIDDHLKRHKKALENIRLAGAAYFDEAMSYVEKHRLYELALDLWKDTDQYKASDCHVLELYGDWLFERRDFRQAASIFVQASATSKAMVAYEKGLEWQELFDLAGRTGISDEDVVDMAYRVAEDLVSKKRHSDAGRILVDYTHDIREAVIALVQGNRFSEARRLITLNKEDALLVDVVHPAALESRAQISEDLSEMRDQLRKQLERVKELRVKKAEAPDAFYNAEDEVNLHNVDAMTDVSMPATAFTRYTAAPSTMMSRGSKMTSRSKRKMERKTGRKGTADEEEYLLKSVSKLVSRFGATQDDARSLLPHLVQLSPEHAAEGRELQSELAQFEAELVAAVAEFWRKADHAEGDGGEEDSWAKRQEILAKQRMIDPVERVPKPNPIGEEWRIKVLLETGLDNGMSDCPRSASLLPLLNQLKSLPRGNGMNPIAEPGYESDSGQRDLPTCEHFRTKTPMPHSITIPARKRFLNRTGRAIIRIVYSYGLRKGDIAHVFGCSTGLISDAIENLHVNPRDRVEEDYDRVERDTGSTEWREVYPPFPQQMWSSKPRGYMKEEQDEVESALFGDGTLHRAAKLEANERLKGKQSRPKETVPLAERGAFDSSSEHSSLDSESDFDLDDAFLRYPDAQEVVSISPALRKRALSGAESSLPPSKRPTTVAASPPRPQLPPTPISNAPLSRSSAQSQDGPSTGAIPKLTKSIFDRLKGKSGTSVSPVLSPVLVNFPSRDIRMSLTPVPSPVASEPPLAGPSTWRDKSSTPPAWTRQSQMVARPPASTLAPPAGSASPVRDQRSPAPSASLPTRLPLPRRSLLAEKKKQSEPPLSTARHPLPSRKREDRLESFLQEPMPGVDLTAYLPIFRSKGFDTLDRLIALGGWPDSAFRSAMKRLFLRNSHFPAGMSAFEVISLELGIRSRRCHLGRQPSHHWSLADFESSSLSAVLSDVMGFDLSSHEALFRSQELDVCIFQEMIRSWLPTAIRNALERALLDKHAGEGRLSESRRKGLSAVEVLALEFKLCIAQSG